MPRKSRRQRIASQHRRQGQPQAKPRPRPTSAGLSAPVSSPSSPAQERVVPPVASSRPTGLARPGARPGSKALPDYSYVGREVRRIAILTAILFGILAALAIALG